MLIDIDNAVINHVRALGAALNPAVYTPTRVDLTLVEDEHTHLRKIEKAALDFNHEPDNTVRRFPFLMVHRKEHLSRLNQASSSKAAIEDIIISQGSPGPGDAVVCDGKQIELVYTIFQYTTDFEELTRMFQYWVLNIGKNFTKMTFSFTEPELSAASWDANLVFSDPGTARPVIRDVEERGTIFVQTFPFSMSTILIGNIRNQNEIILFPELNIQVYRADEAFPI